MTDPSPSLPGLAIVGARGRMGQRLMALAGESGFRVVAAVDRDGPQLDAVDPRYLAVIIDFSHASVATQTARFAAEAGVPCVIGTTGLDASRPLRR